MKYEGFDKKCFNIKPYEDNYLDCFQNLVLSLIKNAGHDPRLFGSVWPWYFYLDKFESVRPYYFVTQQAIMELTGGELTEHCLNSDVICELAQLVLKYPVIVNVDQFYIKHHYKDIYNVKHGNHSLMLLEYNKDLRSFWCVGIMPTYCGWIDEAEVMESILSFEKDNIGYLKCYTYSASVYPIFNNPIMLTRRFINSILLAENDKGMFLNGLYDRIKNFLSNENTFENGIFTQRWFWEIERSGKFVSEFIKSPYCDSQLIPIGKDELLYEMNIINRNLGFSFKLLYKYYLVGKKELYDKALLLLNEAVEVEQNLRKKLV